MQVTHKGRVLTRSVNGNGRTDWFYTDDDGNVWFCQMRDPTGESFTMNCRGCRRCAFNPRTVICPDTAAIMDTMTAVWRYVDLNPNGEFAPAEKARIAAGA